MEFEGTSWLAARGGPNYPNSIECNREGQLAVLLERGAQVWVPRVGEGQAKEFKWAKVVGWSEASKNQLVAKGNGRPNNVQFASAFLLPWSVSGGLNRSYSLNEEIFSSHLSWSPGGFHRGESSFLFLGLTDGNALLLGLTDDCEVKSHECNIHRAICEVSGMYVAYELLTNAEAGFIKAASWFPHRVRLEILKPTDASSCLIMVSCSGSQLNLWVFIKPTNGGKVTLHSRHVSQVLVSNGDSITSLAVLPSLAFSGPDSLKLSNLCFEVACGLYGGGLLRVSVQPKGKDFHGATEGPPPGAFSFNRATPAPLQMLPCPVLGVRPMGGKFGVSKHVIVYGGDRLALANISKLSSAADNAATQSSVASTLQLGNTIMGVAIVQSSLTRPDTDVNMDSDKHARIIAVTLGGEACVCMVDESIRSSITFKAPLCAFSPDKHFMGVCTDFYGLWVCTVAIKTVPPPSQEQHSLPPSSLLYSRMVEITLH